MSRVQEFYDRVEDEYNSFINDIETMDTDQVIENASRIMMFQEVYKFLMGQEPVGEDRYAELLNVEKPIQTICEKYHPLGEELHETIETIMDTVIEESISVKGGEYFEKLKGKIFKLWEEFQDLTVIYVDEETISNIIDGMNSRNFVISEYDSRQLLQFKNPLLALAVEIGKSDDLFEKQVERAIETFERVDLIMYKFELEKENILPETKQRHDALLELTAIIPDFSFQAATEWLTLNRFINEGMYLDCTGEDNPYKDFIDVMKAIKTEHGDDVLQKVFDMGTEVVVQPEELVEVAKYIADGGDANRIKELVDEDFFCVPYENHKQGGMDLC